MDKSRVCINKATKLAKQGCVKKTNLLVYEKKTDPCANPPSVGYVVPPIVSIPAKKIRICTGAELKKMCPPKLCSCPPKKKRLGFFGMLLRLFGFGLKTALAAGLVYWTYDIGLWGDSERTEDMYISFCEMFCPASTERTKQHRQMSELCRAEMDLMCNEPILDANDRCARAPSTAEAVYKFKDTWNRGVVKFFDIITHFPAYIALISFKEDKCRLEREAKEADGNKKK